MLTVTKEFRWDMAHMLACHEGLCKNVHGHTYKMQVEVANSSGAVLSLPQESEDGMIIDFKKLKDIVLEYIIHPLDHAFMYWIGSPDPFEHELAALLKKHNKKIAIVKYKPTAEQMAQAFLGTLKKELSKYNIIVKCVTIWETPTSFAKAMEA